MKYFIQLFISAEQETSLDNDAKDLKVERLKLPVRYYDEGGSVVHTVDSLPPSAAAFVELSGEPAAIRAYLSDYYVAAEIDRTKDSELFTNEVDYYMREEIFPCIEETES